MNLPVEILNRCHSAQLASTVWLGRRIPRIFGQEVVMPNMKKQPGDAVLSRDGTVKVNGEKVGYWTYEAPDIMPPTYHHFSHTKGGDIVFSQMWKHHFKEGLDRLIEGIHADR
jgi:hypothetical protein